MNKCFLHAVVLFAWITPLGNSGSPKSEDTKNIQGTWKAVAMGVEGKKLSEEDVKGIWYKISATEITMGKGDKNLLPPRKYSINPAKKPKQIDIVDIIYVKAKGKQKDTEEKLVMPGIYELNSDTLKIRWVGEGVPPEKLERPTEFKTTGDASWVILKREK